MSASLVGSEMCIRDSDISKLEIRSILGPGKNCIGPDSRDRFFRWRSVAVSYTHLTLPTICSV
eukprot:7725677-Alexandrium_andersonii.AAC.1